MTYFSWPERACVPGAGLQLVLPHLPGEVRDVTVTLRDKMVIIMGIGAVGARLMDGLGQLGVGRVVGVDPDRYGDDSYLTQPARHDDRGKLKSRVQGERVAANAVPGVEVTTAAGFAQDLPFALLRQADLWVMAGDNQSLRAWAGQMAAALGKVLIDVAVHGSTWSAFVRCFDLADPDASCPACLLSEAQWQTLSTRKGCDPERERIENATRAVGTQSTRTLPVFSAMAAQLGVAECLKRLSGVDELALAGEELSNCLLTHCVLRTTLPRNPQCRLPHERWELLDLQEAPERLSLQAIAGSKWSDCSAPPVGLQVRGERPWISTAVCEPCGARVSVRRFARRIGAVVAQCDCGENLRALPASAYSVIPRDDLLASWSVTLPELGLEGSGEAIGFYRGEGWSYFFLPGAPLARGHVIPTTPESHRAKGDHHEEA